MRNRAAQMGATHVLVESRQRHDDGEGREHWSGRGRAYRCEPSSDGTGSPTSGGEAP